MPAVVIWQWPRPVAACRGRQAGRRQEIQSHVFDVRKWIAQRFGAATEESPGREQTRNLAVASLLVEVLRADYDVSAPERRQVLASMGGTLGLDAAECEVLFELAEQRVDRAHDLHQFTSEINRALSHREKLQLVENLWRVAQADAVVHKYEEHLIRRVADLMHVSHREFIAAKLRADRA